jgi:hypothetical protein
VISADLDVEGILFITLAWFSGISLHFEKFWAAVQQDSEKVMQLLQHFWKQALLEQFGRWILVRLGTKLSPPVLLHRANIQGLHFVYAVG